VDRIVKSCPGVIILEPLSQAVRLDPNDAVALLVEIGTAAEGVYRDVVLLDFLAPAFEVLFAHISKKTDETGRTFEDTAGEETFQRLPLARKIFVIQSVLRR
jgi:hypothetical protein